MPSLSARRLRRPLIVLAAILAASILALALRIPITSERLRARLIAALEERLEADVAIGELTLHLYPRLRATGTNLTIRQHERSDVPPLISIGSFKVEADLVGAWRRRVARVAVDGLEITIPPGRGDAEGGGGKAARDEGAHPEAPPTDPSRNPDPSGNQMVVNELIADAARVVVLPRDPEKQPRIWELHQLRLENVGMGQAMPFRSRLTNAVPPGEVTTAGRFGPWNVREPGATPLDGEYVFRDADLGVFRGVGGILSAKGNFSGTLNRIEVNGESDTPEFTVTAGGQPVPLRTKYRAIVDGTNGDTTLDPVEASFLDTSLVARGGVYDVKDVKGRIVKLDVEIAKGRIEDVMRLAVRSEEPPMTGALRLVTRLELPPGEPEVVDRLALQGEFAIDDGRFTNPDVQRKIADLSRRARGRKAKEESRNVESDFGGKFVLGAGVLRLRDLVFDVPGAAVDLTGRYALRAETLSFNGNLYMDASVSQTMTGFKSVLLKIVDPLFRRNGRTVVPIKIEGTRSDPKFGLDVKRVFSRD